MMLNLTKTFDGEWCMEMWVGDKKVTVYVYPTGKTEGLLVKSDGGIVEENNLFEALNWIQS